MRELDQLLSLKPFLFEFINDQLEYWIILFKTWAIIDLFLIYFWSFQNNQYKFYNKLMWKNPSNIRRQDSKSQLSDHESHPLTTGPGLASKHWFHSPSCFLCIWSSIKWCRFRPKDFQVPPSNNRNFFDSFATLALFNPILILSFQYFQL